MIDHAWTYRVAQARDHLYSMPSLLERMSALMEIEVGEKSMEDIVEDVLQTMWKYELRFSFIADHFILVYF